MCPASLQYSRRWWVVATVMLLAILEVLDSTIVNVALPSMMASLGATQNQVTWVLTSYVVASAIILPISGFLMNTFGQRRFLFICATGFMLSSFLCGASTSLTEIVIFRVFQGLFGASMIPISQTILRMTFPLEEQGKAMTIWGLGILVAPVFGPTLGGYITEYSTWRWVFYVNLPFCILAIIMIGVVVPKVTSVKKRLDFLGLFLMVVGVGCLQIFLDKGNDKSWLATNSMQALFVTAIFALVYLLIRCVNSNNPIINLKLYRDRNFGLCSLMMMIFCGTVFSFITIQPLFLESYFNYTAVQAGLLMSPLGLSSAVGMATALQSMKRFPVKYILVVAFSILSLGLVNDMHISLQAGASYLMTSNAVIGFGMGFAMVPLSTYVFSTLNSKHIADASGLFGYARMLGTSIGTALVSTLISEMTQVSWHDLVAQITPFNVHLTYWLQHQNLHSLDATALARLSYELERQSAAQAFIDAFKVLSLPVFVLIPLALALKNVKLSSERQSMGH